MESMWDAIRAGKATERSAMLKDHWNRELKEQAEIHGVDWGSEDGDKTATGIRCVGPIIITLADGSQHEFKEGTIHFAMKKESHDIEFKDEESALPRKFCITGSFETAHINHEALQQLILAGQALREKVQETAEEIVVVCGPAIRTCYGSMLEQLQEMAKMCNVTYYDADWDFKIVTEDELRFRACRAWMLGGELFYGYTLLDCDIHLRCRGCLSANKVDKGHLIIILIVIQFI